MDTLRWMVDIFQQTLKMLGLSTMPIAVAFGEEGEPPVSALHGIQLRTYG